MIIKPVHENKVLTRVWGAKTQDLSREAAHIRQIPANPRSRDPETIMLCFRTNNINTDDNINATDKHKCSRMILMILWLAKKRRQGPEGLLLPGRLQEPLHGLAQRPDLPEGVIKT